MRAWACVVSVALALVFYSPPVHGCFSSGNDLKADLKDQDDCWDSAHAYGFIKGVFEVVSVICQNDLYPPEDLQFGKVYSIVKKYVYTHSELLHLPAHYLVRWAIVDVWGDEIAKESQKTEIEILKTIYQPSKINQANQARSD